MNFFCFSPQFQVTYEVLPQGLVFSSDCVPSKEVNIDGGGLRLQGKLDLNHVEVESGMTVLLRSKNTNNNVTKVTQKYLNR